MSPLIEDLRWGRMTIAGIGRGKDFKLWPGGGRPWDWRETGTHHRPGIQVADLEELIEQGARHVVLSRGRLLALQVPAATLAHLEARDVVFDVLETRAAADRYNRLARRGQAVAGLFHSTC